MWALSKKCGVRVSNFRILCKMMQNVCTCSLKYVIFHRDLFCAAWVSQDFVRIVEIEIPGNCVRSVNFREKKEIRKCCQNWQRTMDRVPRFRMSWFSFHVRRTALAAAFQVSADLHEQPNGCRWVAEALVSATRYHLVLPFNPHLRDTLEGSSRLYRFRSFQKILNLTFDDFQHLTKWSSTRSAWM